MSHKRPVILCFSGLDPSGGAGLQADIETIAALGGHAAPIMTANTQQDTRHVYGIQPAEPAFILKQAEHLLADMPVQAIKIGMLGHHEIAEAVAQIIESNPEIPVIFDPVLASGLGDSLSTDALLDTIRTRLLKLSHIITPNTLEAERLSQPDETAEAAAAVLSESAQYVLLTGSHAPTDEITHRLYHKGQLLQTYHNPRLPAEYHGSGCTLAAALAYHIATGLKIEQACQRALDFSYNSLLNAHAPGTGQSLPGRVVSHIEDKQP